MIQFRSHTARASALALGAALIIGIFAPVHVSAAALKPLVVQPSEVASAFGADFKTLSMRPMRPSDLTGMTATGTAILMKGYIGGYMSSFYRPPTAGVTVVTSGVSVYTSANYPRAALEQTMKDQKAIVQRLQNQYITRVHLNWVSGIGEKAIKLTYTVRVPALTSTGKLTTTQAVTLLFSRGRFASSLNVSGRGSVSSSQALTLAQRVDARLQHAG